MRQISELKCFQFEGRDYRSLHRYSTGSVFDQSNDELSPSPTSELMPVATCADATDLEEALREISREISSEFSCARDIDPSSPGQCLISEAHSPGCSSVTNSCLLVHSRRGAGLVQ